MQIVYRAESIVDAHLVKDALDQAEIPAFINGEYLIGGMGQLPARDFLSVSVPDGFVEAAGPVVEEISKMLSAPVADERMDDDAAPGLQPWPAPG